MNILSSSVFELNPAAHKSGLLTVLDIGSSKISCLIVRLSPLQKTLHLPWRTHRIDVLGFAARQSHGVRAGMVVDIAAAEQTVRKVVDAAERMAGLIVKSVIVNFSGRHMKSERIKAETPLRGERVDLGDVRQVIQLACGMRHRRPILHAVPLAFKLDEAGDLEDPRDMAGTILGIDMHCLGIDAVAARNLEHCLNRAYLKVEALVAAPYAAALSTLLSEEVLFGATCVDFGGGTTSFSVFRNGKFVYADSISIGGAHITADIAQGFSISLEEAERLKIMHGSAADYECSRENDIRLTDGRSISPYELARIIRPRVEEISEIVRDKSSNVGFRPIAGRRLVLTGGASQLAGLTSIVQNVMQIKPRLGRPLGISGLPQTARCGAYAVLAGQAIYPQSLGFFGQEFNLKGTEYDHGSKLKNARARFLQSVNGYVKVFRDF